MTLHVGPLPAGDERHLKAIEAGRDAIVGVVDDHLRFNEAAYGKAWTGETADTQFIVANSANEAVAAYHAQLRKDGVRLVDASEVAEWLRGHTTWEGKQDRISVAYADAFLARFGGGDEERERPVSRGPGDSSRGQRMDGYNG